MFEFVFEHVDEVLEIVFGQFLKVLFGRWIDGWMKHSASQKQMQGSQVRDTPPTQVFP